MGASWTLHNIGGAIGLTLATVIYRVWASAALQKEASPHLRINVSQSDKWVSEPEHALEHLVQAGLDPSQARALAEHSFITGYDAAMVLLVAAELAVLAAIALLRFAPEKCSVNKASASIQVDLPID